MLRHREVANRDCGVCQLYLFDEETGRLTKGRDGKPELRSDYGEGICPAPCRTEKGCPKGTPENPRSLNAVNQLCYEHYLECKAVGQFPDDPIVKRNAAIIQDVTEQAEAEKREEFQTTLIQLSLVKGGS